MAGARRSDPNRPLYSRQAPDRAILVDYVDWHAIVEAICSSTNRISGCTLRTVLGGDRRYAPGAGSPSARGGWLLPRPADHLERHTVSKGITLVKAILLPMTAREFVRRTVTQTTLTLSEEITFFDSLKLRNGVSKVTYANRLDSANDMLVRNMSAASFSSPVSCLDVGCSSGVSTLELYQKLKTAYDVKVLGIDIMTTATLVKRFPGFYILMDETGFPLQYDLFGYAIRPWSRGRRELLTGYALLRSCAGLAFRLSGVNNAKARSVEQSARNDQESARVDSTSVSLLVPALQWEKSISVRDHDIFQSLPEDLLERFDVARAANILNLGYFSPERILLAVRNIRRCLKPSRGLFLVCRTGGFTAHHQGSTDGSLFRLTESGSFVLADRLGRGSEVEDIVLSA
jgi:SAM-dependent methyltransferase